MRWGPTLLGEWLRVAPVQRRSRGQIVVLYSLLGLLLCGFAGFSVDVGFMLAQRRNFQKLAAVCAIESAQLTSLSANTVYARASGCATANGLAASDLEYPTSSSYAPQSGAKQGDPAFVEVRLRRQQPTFFAKVLGIQTMPVYGRAVAGGATPADFALMGLQGDVNSTVCNGCPSTTIVGSACTRGAFRDPSGQMSIVGEAAANQGFNGNPSTTGGLFSPGQPCLDPDYALPTPIPVPQAMPSSGTLDISGAACPSAGNTLLFSGDGNRDVTINCSSSSATVQLRGPRRTVTVAGTNNATVELLGNPGTASDRQTGQFQNVVVTQNSDGLVRLMPGFYDTIQVGKNTAVRFKKGLYLITTSYTQDSGSTVDEDSIANPDDTSQTGVSMVIGLLFQIASGNGSFSLANGCCATQMANQIQLYHLGGCAAPYSGTTPSPLLAWPSPWSCGNGTVTNQIDWGGNNSTRVFTGSIYSPYLCTGTSFPASCSDSTAPTNNRPAPNTLPQAQCGTSASLATCMLIHGSAGTSVTGQLIAPTILFDGNGMALTWTGGSTGTAGQPYLAE